ncbi:MAG: hypothetical protein P8M70_04285 [Verrucomicrobiota bacterium]|nr:hypothetical protein [Verrucomicrobiota bacterium]
MKITHFCLLYGILSLPLAGANNPPPPKVPKLDIRLVHQGYKTNPENFVVVCNSAAMAIARYYPKRTFKPILIPKADNGFPVKLDQQGPKGESQVMLSISDGYVWNQIAYQFAHEFTHILINEGQPSAGPNHWINEAFCEVASYQALKQMAKEWESHPPYSNWKGYAKHHSSYADKYLGKEKARPEDMDFKVWFRKNEAALRLGKRHPKYGLYKYPAYQFYQIIKEDPSQLGALAYLNYGLTHSGISTKEYLARWKYVLPPVHKPFADKVAGVFGYSLSK